ncbi:hypothetical protein [Microbispora sp. ATCC PTA-5024]|uniref:hypothetical protein n=1 Tax=Microbispora sp. ATCC PTA-5024 TaxID=316330 RepID=UPI0003DC18CB|nr:hypothetical protein [Microbispora sp. ATCC PTA-5024]ETK33819.1 hypothetical protein MPTA5024_22690 [Microbispora sp. ATCC PTA-5024]
MKISYSVPAETTSVFVVAADRTPTELSSIVPWRMGRAHRRRAMDALGTPRLEIEAYRQSRSPWRGTDLPAGPHEQVHRARYHVVVSSTAPVTEQPEAAQAARAAARGVAEAYGGVIVDPLTGAVVDHCPDCPGERQEFRVGDDWLGWAVDVDESRSGAACDPLGAGVCTCLRVASRGLSRFGLPEVVLDGGPCPHSLCAVATLLPVAEHLLSGHLAWLAREPHTRHPHAREPHAREPHAREPHALLRTIDRRIRLAGREVAEVAGSPDPEGDPFLVRLTPAVAGRACLRVDLPAEGTTGDRPHHTPGLLAA